MDSILFTALRRGVPLTLLSEADAKTKQLLLTVPLSIKSVKPDISVNKYLKKLTKLQVAKVHISEKLAKEVDFDLLSTLIKYQVMIPQIGIPKEAVAELITKNLPLPAVSNPFTNTDMISQISQFLDPSDLAYASLVNKDLAKSVRTRLVRKKKRKHESILAVSRFDLRDARFLRKLTKFNALQVSTDEHIAFPVLPNVTSFSIYPPNGIDYEGDPFDLDSFPNLRLLAINHLVPIKAKHYPSIKELRYTVFGESRDLTPIKKLVKHNPQLENLTINEGNGFDQISKYLKNLKSLTLVGEDESQDFSISNLKLLERLTIENSTKITVSKRNKIKFLSLRGYTVEQQLEAYAGHMPYLEHLIVAPLEEDDVSEGFAAPSGFPGLKKLHVEVNGGFEFEYTGIPSIENLSIEGMGMIIELTGDNSGVTVLRIEAEKIKGLTRRKFPKLELLSVNEELLEKYRKVFPGVVQLEGFR